MIKSGGRIVLSALLGSGIARPRLVVAGASGIWPKKSVAWAFTLGSAEEGPNWPFQSHHRKLVDGGDKHGWRATVDLFVDHLDGSPWWLDLVRLNHNARVCLRRR